ncbi:type 2 lantibiotic [Paenibacillus thiaminolyticus]|uniref:Type 2 lantibiotic n=1 Tax=Paenibacillus thiaminolyticus TaxID=49283 RepID=A0AAP9DUG8_PANTH|nr:type 2 lantibiotic [Paenibacillus thiaminolyticus]SUA96118.1 type 2 lantibiotic, SP_1948 family [Paenibacillus thiaminolyticus]
MALNNQLEHSPVGKSLKSLSEEEMASIFGGNGMDVEVRSSLVCGAGISYVASYLASAAFKCGKKNKN